MFIRGYFLHDYILNVICCCSFVVSVAVVVVVFLPCFPCKISVICMVALLHLVRHLVRFRCGMSFLSSFFLLHFVLVHRFVMNGDVLLPSSILFSCCTHFMWQLLFFLALFVSSISDSTALFSFKMIHMAMYRLTSGISTNSFRFA